MLERQAERFLALPGVHVEFSSKENIEDGEAHVGRLVATRVRDLSVLDCAFDIDSPCKLHAGSRGMVFIALGRRMPTVVRGCTVTRVWDGGVAVRFDDPQHMRPYCGDTVRDAFSGQKAFDRKMKLSLIEIVQLSNEAGRLEISQLRVMVAGIALSAILLALLPLWRSLSIAPGWRCLAEIMPAFTVTACAMLSFQRLGFLNRLRGFLTLLQRQVDEGSFLPDYWGWDAALSDLHNHPEKSEGHHALSSTESAWSLRLEGHLSIGACLAGVAYVFIYILSTGAASHSLVTALRVPTDFAFISAGVLTLLALAVPATVLWMGVRVLMGKGSARAWLDVWRRLLGDPTAPR
jgi:hypothetical protein